MTSRWCFCEHELEVLSWRLARHGLHIWPVHVKLCCQAATIQCQEACGTDCSCLHLSVAHMQCAVAVTAESDLHINKCAKAAWKFHIADSQVEHMHCAALAITA
jgi:hypothetical protein